MWISGKIPLFIYDFKPKTLWITLWITCEQNVELWITHSTYPLKLTNNSVFLCTKRVFLKKLSTNCG